ncbi:MAG: peptide chain release factor N(5)-glutamine methyltransferase [Methylococcaceae bacterium]|nr:peptide chain release factor N(5)-glutamine methyltransferase [Methylococcaceae bacterium]
MLNVAVRSLEAISESALLDAEVLLCLALDTTRSSLRAWPDKLIPSDQQQRFLALLKDRQQGTPIAYISGVREFWSRDFDVTPDVLIPRPDTELLVELSLNLIPLNQALNILDLGTGSGNIAITLAAERPASHVSASDSSSSALRIAERNAMKHDISNIQFYLSDWFASIPSGSFTLVVSNPPYIAENDAHLQQGDLRFEPYSALCAMENGLSAIRILADNARHYLEPDGHLLIEHGYDQQQSVTSIFEECHYKNIKTFTDLSGQPRVTYGQKPGSN